MWNWLVNLVRGRLKQGVSISVTRPWPGDEKLPLFTGEFKEKSADEIMSELAEKNKQHKKDVT